VVLTLWGCILSCGVDYLFAVLTDACLWIAVLLWFDFVFSLLICLFALALRVLACDTFVVICFGIYLRLIDGCAFCRLFNGC